MMKKTKIIITSKALSRERWRDFFELIFLVVILAIFIRSFLLGVYRVSTNTMAPTLMVGDFIWASKTSYGVKIPFTSYKLWQTMPDKGDLVVALSSHSNKRIMRVMAHPGDHVEFKDHQLWVNGKVTFTVPSNSIDPFTSTTLASASPSLPSSSTLKKSGYSTSHSTSSSIINTPSLRLMPLVVSPGEVFMISERTERLEDGVGMESANTEYTLWSLIPVEQVESQVKGIWFSLAWPSTSLNPAFNSANDSRESIEPQLRWDRIGTLF